MSKIQFYRSVIAASIIAAIWYFVALSQATELHPMVVAGIPADSIATERRTPECPRVGSPKSVSDLR
jgi:hypothetical protein